MARAHRVLNARLYRTAWLVAAVAVVVALLTLQPRAVAPEPEVPPAVDGALVRDAADNLHGFAPVRPAGATLTEDRVVRWIETRMEALPGVRVGSVSRVRRQEFQARVDGRLQRMVNLYLALPGAGDGVTRPAIVVVAPRDTPADVASGASDTALLLELARLSATSAHRRPLLFVSTSGSTTGNAGARWFLRRFSDSRIGAVIVLDGLGERSGRVHIWPGGSDASQTLELDAVARAAVVRAGAEPAAVPSVWTQLLRLAVPQTFGDQGPFLAAGFPAVTLSSRGEGTRSSADVPDAEALTRAGNIALNLMGALDEADSIPGPSAAVVLADKDLRPGVLRIVLLLLALPLLVAAVDALARLRRAGVRIGPGMRAVGWRALPLLTGAVVLHVLAVAGLMPPTAAGAPPIPADVALSARGGLALAGAALAGVVVWLAARRRTHSSGAAPASEAAAGLIALAAVVLVAWVVSPFALVLALPAAHAALIATGVHRIWHLAALAGVAVLPLVALAVSVGSVVDRNPLWAVWYLVATAAAGARGFVGPAIGIALAACLWSVGALVALRARKGLMGARHDTRRPRRRRPPDRRRPAPRGAA